MRAVLFFSAFLTIAACSSPDGTGNQSSPAPAITSTPSAKDAQSAKAFAGRYMALVNAKDYAAARAMWGHGGADAGGSTADFARSFDMYRSYEGTVGDPTPTVTRDGQQYVAVNATAHVVGRKSGTPKDIVGLIRLRRPVGREAWEIWAIDLRRDH